MDEPIDVERNPEGSGLVISVRISPNEATEVLRCAEFDGKFLAEWVHDLVIQRVYQTPWVRSY